MHVPILIMLAVAGTPDALRSNDTPTEILIDFKNDVNKEDVEKMAASLEGLLLDLNSEYSKAEKIYRVDVSGLPKASVDNMIAKIAHVTDLVEGAEWNYVYQISGEDSPDFSGAPNDPMWDKQWSFRMIDAPKAWEHGANGSGATVAVIDTGVAFEDYEEFRKIEDLSGTEFVPGYDFVNDDEHANDDHGHGSHVAGTIAQTTNNGRGVAGLAYKAKIMPLKVLNKQGYGTVADIADAIRFAADEGANVINMSLGGGGHSSILEKAVAYAHKKGLIVVCAAGNSGRGIVEYPAAYKGAFAVSSVGPDRQLAYYSSWGRQIAIAAPGGDKQKGGEEGAILQNTVNAQNLSQTDFYAAWQGTSMATPHVAGAAALIMSKGTTVVDKVESILKSSADKASPKEKFGAGILNVGRAVTEGEKEAEGTPWWKMLLTLVIALLMWLTRLKNVAGLSWIRWLGNPLLWVGALLASTGLGFLHRFGVHGFWTAPMPLWDMAVTGVNWHNTALWASAIPVTLLTISFFALKPLRGFFAGVALGWGMHLLWSSVVMPSDILFMPWTASPVDAAWLVLNSVVLFVLAERLGNSMSTKRVRTVQP